MQLRTLEQLDIAGKRVLLRVDINEPEDHGALEDNHRIRAVVPTIRKLRERGAARITLLAHRTQRKHDTAPPSLAFIVPHLERHFGVPVTFLEHLAHAAEKVSAGNAGQVFLLENLRIDPGEEANDPTFAARLATLGEVFVQEAFGAVHRAHASTALLPTLLPSAAGPLVLREVEEITRLRCGDVPRPFVAVIGGAKISTKLPLIESLLAHVDGLCLGGALANTVLKAKGVAIGKSLVEEAMVQHVQSIELTDTKLHLPIDVVVSTATDGSAAKRHAGVGGMRDDELILDIGTDTQVLFANVIHRAKTVFWNGPMGLVEVEAFRAGTDAVALALANTKGYTLVGGGDTTEHLTRLGIEDDISFISTGGGAMLELLAGEPMPGLAPLAHTNQDTHVSTNKHE